MAVPHNLHIQTRNLSSIGRHQPPEILVGVARQMEVTLSKQSFPDSFWSGRYTYLQEFCRWSRRLRWAGGWIQLGWAEWFCPIPSCLWTSSAVGCSNISVSAEHSAIARQLRGMVCLQVVILWMSTINSQRPGRS